MKRVPIRHSTSGYYSLISIGWVGGDTQLLLALLSKLPSNYDPEFHIGDSTRGFAAMTLAHIANRPRNALEVYWIRAIWCCDAPKWCEMSWWQMEAQLTRCHPTGAFKPYHMAFNRGRGGKGREREAWSSSCLPFASYAREGSAGWVTQDVLQFCRDEEEEICNVQSVQFCITPPFIRNGGNLRIAVRGKCSDITYPVLLMSKFLILLTLF